MGPEEGGGGEEAAGAAVGRPASCCQNGCVETLLRSGLVDAVGEMIEVTEEAGGERAGTTGAEPERGREWSSGPVNMLVHSSFGISFGIWVASGEAGRDSGDAYMAARQVARSLMIIFGRRRFNALPAWSLVVDWTW